MEDKEPSDIEKVIAEFMGKMKRLRSGGATYKKIGKSLDLDWRTVRKHLGMDPIDQVAHMLRKCLFNPYLSVPPRHVRYPLELYGQDWRLNPITWFQLCTPDLSDDTEPYWEQAYPKFMKYLTRTQFWSHYVKLRYDVFKLHKEYENAVQKLSGSDISLRECWDNLESQRLRHFPLARVPTFPEPNWNDWEPGYDQEYCDKILSRFSSIIPDVHDRLISLDNMLQQLNDDLTIGRIKVKR